MGELTTAMQARIDRITEIIRKNSWDGMLECTAGELAEHIAGLNDPPMPRIVCLCGSTRFYEAFQRANYEETMAGRIVLSVGFYPHSSEAAHGQHVGCDDERKRELDKLHLRKIDLADEILVLNCPRVWCLNHQRWTDPVDGEFCCVAVEERPYVGDSTRREIEHATRTGKPVRWLNPVD